jgi:hypothetical protein
MNALMIFINERETFAPDKLRRILASIPGVRNLDGPNFGDSPVACDYDFADDKTTLRLSNNLQTISIHGLGYASLKLALELQHRETCPLRVTDWGYDFEFSLQSVRTIEEMLQKIDAEVHETERPAPVEKVT